METLQEVLGTPPPFVAGAVSIPMRRVALKDWQAMLKGFGEFAQAIARGKPDGYRLTEADAAREMPAVLLNAWTLGDRADIREMIAFAEAEPEEGEPAEATARRREFGERWRAGVREQREGVLRFLGYFCEVTEALLDALDPDAWHGLWARIWERSQVPFGQRLGLMHLGGELEPATLRPSSPPASTPAGSTLETPGSALNTPSSSSAGTPPGSARRGRSKRSSSGPP